ncbi:MAG: HlyC/CorC family transporter, partial [Gemmatimonadetes bacterium]|nr:HlyC/CorC family transporter [Gemmatimonadota bacterium]
MTVYIIILIAGIVASAFLSASEASFISVNKVRVRHLAAGGNRSARAVIRVVDEHQKFFGTVLLTNNAVNTVLAAVATSLAIRLWGNTGDVVAIAAIVITAALVVLTDLTPKSVATLISEKWALATGTIIRGLMTIAGPLVYVFTLIPRGIVHLLGGHEALTTPTITEGELRMLIDLGEAEGTVEAEQGQMLESVFRFGELEVRDIMTPRNEIVWVPAAMTLGDFLGLQREHSHSRFPVYEDDFDDVVGILSIKDVVRALAEGTADMSRPAARVMRTALFVPETKPVDELFTRMQRSGHRIALVVDEYGGISGLVTMTRLLEQIVGPTGEEGSRPDERFIAVDAHTYDLDGGMSIVEANTRLDLGIPEGDYETVAGFVLDQLQRI